METPSRYTVGLIQMAMSSDPSGNLARAVTRIEEAAGRGAQVICLPELFRTPCFCQREDTANFDLAEPLPGPTTEALAEAPTDREATLLAEVDLGRIEETRQAWPLLRYRRIDAYEDITRRLLDGPPVGP
jgi:N-carbamoylputrescine amidase